MTNPDKSALFQKQSAPPTFSATTNEHPTIEVDDSRTFQTIDGFGFTLTGGSAMHIVRMATAARAALLREVVRHGWHKHRHELFAAERRRVRLERAGVFLR